MNPLYLTLAMRAVYLGLIVNAAVRDVTSLGMHGSVFVLSLFIPYLGRKDNRFYFLDSYTMFLFSAAILVGSNLGFSYTLGIIAIDGIFHFLGGVGAGWCVFLFYEKHLKHEWVLAMTIVMTALAIGAAWEVFEWILWSLPEPWHVANEGYADTNLDLIADVLGAMAFVAIHKVKKAFK